MTFCQAVGMAAQSIRRGAVGRVRRARPLVDFFRAWQRANAGLPKKRAQLTAVAALILFDGLQDLLQVERSIEPLDGRDALATVALLHTDVDEVALATA